MDDNDLIAEIEQQISLMREVATGGARISEVDVVYKDYFSRIRDELLFRGIDYPNPYRDLWQWHGYWKENLPTYQDRRKHLADMFAPVFESIDDVRRVIGNGAFRSETGWTKVDRTVAHIRASLANAQETEQFQSVGLLCREVMISLAQTVFDPQTHQLANSEIQVSDTDAKRMLEAYLGHELSGKSNEAARRHAKAALDLANALQHRRTATFRDAALCSEGTIAVVNIAAILSHRRGLNLNSGN